MIFDFQRQLESGTSETVPGAQTRPNMTIPRTAPLTSRAPTAMTFGFLAQAGAGACDIAIFGLVESSDDTNAVDDFAEVQEQANTWVFLNAFTVNHGATLGTLTNITPGRYYVRVTAVPVGGGRLVGAAL